MYQSLFKMENSLNINDKAIIVGVSQKETEEFNYEMKELASLCEACNLSVVSQVIQLLDHPNNATYVGSGKIFEIKNLVDIYDASCVVFNDELSPACLSNIADILDVEIIDRTMLILEIFSKRVKTKEASLQVELANLNYMLPRLVGKRKNLSRTGGGSSGGSGARRGSGETKLELDRRYISSRIVKVKQELESVVKDRQTSRKSRAKNGMKIVAFVGYTNAGKSSTINTIIEKLNGGEEKKVFVKDMLFATLETSTRRIVLPNNHDFLITDTVGFVNKLPHHLVESFKSTLEEIKEASLIVHVIDANSPYLLWQIETTTNVLKSLGVADIPTLYVYNKLDLVTNRIFIPTTYQPMLEISNKTLEGIDELLNYIDNTLYSDIITTKMLIPFSSGNIYNILKSKGNITVTNYLNDGIYIEVSLSKHLYELYKQYEITK